MAECGVGNCTGRMRRMWPQRGPIDATPFKCSNCGRTAHSAACVDPNEGTVECICGLADLDAKRAEVEPDDAGTVDW